MLHQVYGRKLSRPTGHRTALFKNLVRELVVRGKITTTKQKAKAVVGVVDRIVARAKKDRVSGSREAVKILGERKLVNKFVNKIVPVFAERAGGVTRTIPLGVRASDTAQMVRMEWVTEVPVAQVQTVGQRAEGGRQKTEDRRQKTEDRRQKTEKSGREIKAKSSRVKGKTDFKSKRVAGKGKAE